MRTRAQPSRELNWNYIMWLEEETDRLNEKIREQEKLIEEAKSIDWERSE